MFTKQYASIIDSGKIVYGKFTYAIPKYFIKKLEFINDKLFQIVKEKGHQFWINFVWDDRAKRNAIARTNQLLQKLNLFRSPLVNCLAI